MACLIWQVFFLTRAVWCCCLIWQVFFEGISHGEATRQAFSRTLFGTDQPDAWSVLVPLAPAAVIPHGTPAGDSLRRGVKQLAEVMREGPAGVNGTCATPHAPPREVFEAIAAHLHAIPPSRVRSMRDFIIRALPKRSSRPAGFWFPPRAPPLTDHTDRLVLAMVWANVSAPARPMGSPLSWPLEAGALDGRARGGREAPPPWWAGGVEPRTRARHLERWKGGRAM
jgi:hypothetical protein